MDILLALLMLPGMADVSGMMGVGVMMQDGASNAVVPANVVTDNNGNAVTDSNGDYVTGTP